MRLRQAVRRVRDAEVAVLCVSAQAVGFEIFFAVMADGDGLLRPRFLAWLCGLSGAPPRLRLDGLAGGGFRPSCGPTISSSPRSWLRALMRLSWPWMPPVFCCRGRLTQNSIL